jgi:hypothetical protein
VALSAISNVSSYSCRLHFFPALRDPVTRRGRSPLPSLSSPPGMGFAFAKIDYRRSSPRVLARYYLLILVFFLCLHLILSNFHESYGNATSLSKITRPWLLHGNSSSESLCANVASTTKDQCPHPWHLPQTGKFDRSLTSITNN